MGPAASFAACNIAEDNLDLGHTVITGSVNPIELTRKAYRKIAVRTGKPFLEAEIVCSDPQFHRDRVEARRPKRRGLPPPSWSS